MPAAFINGHNLYYEIHGDDRPDAIPLLCTTGWGTFCHGKAHHLPRGLTDRFKVIVYDHRGIAESTDDPGVMPTMALRANDAIGLLDHLNLKNVHLVGIAGMGACICQEVAIQRPDLGRSLINSGAWCFVDDAMAAQLNLWRDVHRQMGFAAFQQLVTLTAFSADYYNAKKDKLLGPAGGWSELNGRYSAHDRITESCLSHHSIDRLDQIQMPTLLVHMGRDQITAPRLTLPIEQAIPNARGVMMEDAAHVPTGREQKSFFDSTLLEFLQNV